MKNDIVNSENREILIEFLIKMQSLGHFIH